MLRIKMAHDCGLGRLLILVGCVTMYTKTNWTTAKVSMSAEQMNGSFATPAK